MARSTNRIHDIEIIEDSDDLPESAPAIVMIHGWPDTWRLWDDQVVALRSRYRCFRFTLPGFDINAAARPTSLAQMIELCSAIVGHAGRGRPVTLLLHDWGCLFGYQFALARPDMVARVIGVDVGDAASPAFKNSLSAKAKLMVAGYQLWLVLAWKIGGQLGDRMTRRMAKALPCTSDPARIGVQMNYPYAMRWLGAFGGLKGVKTVLPVWPMLFIYGQRKPFMFHSTGWAQDLVARPGSAVLGLRAGHWVMRDQPEAFNQAVLDWLAKS